jgi:hypothetical protein
MTSVALAAAARTGRWRMRKLSTSPMVKRPTLRNLSAISSSGMSHATRKPME